jgi:hypothetical protein
MVPKALRPRKLPHRQLPKEQAGSGRHESLATIDQPYRSKMMDDKGGLHTIRSCE